MVAINPEMLRELLDEFTEKELVTKEEINVITQQIGELEKRIDTNQEKLASLVRAHAEAKKLGLKLLAGSEFVLDGGDGRFRLIALAHNLMRTAQLAPQLIGWA